MHAWDGPNGRNWLILSIDRKCHMLQHLAIQFERNYETVKKVYWEHTGHLGYIQFVKIVIHPKKLVG